MLHSKVREYIEEMILTGQLPAGERLNENELAEKFNISRAPIREATRALAETGLLTYIRNRGVFVREIGLQEALELYDIRSGYARVAGRLAALRATPQQAAELERLWDSLEKARSTREPDQYYEFNRIFHAKIVEASGNQRLINLHESTERELILFLRQGVFGAQRLDASNRDHRHIVDHIVNGDEMGAASAFEQHVISGKERMLASLSRFVGA